MQCAGNGQRAAGVSRCSLVLFVSSDLPLVELGSVLEGKEQGSVTFENWLLVSERDLRAAAFKARCREAGRNDAKQPFAFAFFYDDAAQGDAGVVWTCAETTSMSSGDPSCSSCSLDSLKFGKLGSPDRAVEQEVMVLAVVEKRMQQISQDLAVMGKEMEDLSMSMSGENAEKARLYYELVGRVDTLEEELASAREAASGAEAKAAALAQLKDKLAASLKAKMQEQIEKQEQLEKEKKALEDRVKGMREGEGEAMKELSAQLAAAEEERGRAGVELEQMKLSAFCPPLDALEKDRTQIEEESVRLKAFLAEAVKECNMPRRILRTRPHNKTDSQISENLQQVLLHVPEEGLLFSVDSFERDSVRSKISEDAKSVRVQISLIESHCVSSPAASVKGSCTEVS